MLLPLENIFILTGAGVSAESGIPTFRGANGLWRNYKIEDVATPAAFNKNPALVWEFYFERIDKIVASKPNEAHLALNKLVKKGKHINIITQNVDNLHERAGSNDVIHMHGSIMRALCPFCGNLYDIEDIERPIPKCTKCGHILRPYVVWFGERPRELDRIYKLLTESSVFISIGTSGIVYPASEFHLIARESGAKTIFINIEDLHIDADQFFIGKASVVLPHLIDRWIKQKGILFK